MVYMMIKTIASMLVLGSLVLSSDAQARTIENTNETLVLGFRQYSENNRGRVMLFKEAKVSGEKCKTIEEGSKVECTVDEVVLTPNVNVNLKGQNGVITYAVAGIIKDQTTVMENTPVKLKGTVTLSSSNKGISWQVAGFKLTKI